MEGTETKREEGSGRNRCQVNIKYFNPIFDKLSNPMGIPRKRAAEQYLSDLPRWLIAATIIIPITFGTFGYKFPGTTSPDNTRLFLSALAGAQASVLAIVFSVTLLGIQLATTRYATRMIPLFVKSPIFRFTLILFLSSIAVDFVILYNLPQTTSEIDTAAVYFASGAAVVSAITLTVFIPRILYRGTPDGLINAFEDSLHFEAYRRKTGDFADSNARADHPLQPLHALTMSALSRREWATAERGLEGFTNIAKGVIPNLSNKSEDRRQSPSRQSKALFDMPLGDFLSEITLHAHEKDEKEIVRQSIAVQEEIGELAFQNYYHYITVQAAEGLSNSIQEAPPTSEGNSIRGHGFRSLRGFLEDFANRPSPYHVKRILSITDHQLGILFRKDAEKWVYREILLRYFDGTLPEVQSTILDLYGSYLNEVDVDWRQQYPSNSTANSRLLEMFFKWRGVYVESTLHILRYYDRNDDYPMTYGDFFGSWKQVCSTAVESEAPEYAEVMCELFIESAYIGSTIDEDSYRAWVSRFASVKQDNPAIVDAAYATLRAEGRTGLMNYFYEESQSGSGWSGILQRIRGSDPRFNEWVERFEDDVDEEYQDRLQRDQE